MGGEKLAAIRQAATHVRQVIERRELRRFAVALTDFPHGSCGDATLLLGAYLTDRGLGPCRYVLGDRPTDNPNGYRSHAWLEVGDLIVDITADQFADGLGPVEVTTRRDWHEKFEQDPDEPEHPADFRLYDPHTVSTLAPVYRAILEAENQATRQSGPSSVGAVGSTIARSPLAPQETHLTHAPIFGERDQRQPHE